MDTQSAIGQATLAFYLGNKAQARALLKAALNQEPHNENAWLLYADVAENEEHSIYCLQKVLELNPSNESAKKYLLALTHPTPSIAPIRPHIEHVPGQDPPAKLKPCPYCAEMIQEAAIVCRFCGRDLQESAAVSPEAESSTPVALQAYATTKQTKASFGLSPVLVLILIVIGVCICGWASIQGRGTSNSSSNPPTLAPASQPLSSQCQIDPIAGRQYANTVHNILLTQHDNAERVMSIMNGYTDGTVSLSELAQETSYAISDQERLYEEIKSIVPPAGMTTTHRKLIDSAFLYLTALRALYVYTQTLDTSYVDRTHEFLQSATEELSDYNAEIQRIMDQCEP